MYLLSAISADQIVGLCVAQGARFMNKAVKFKNRFWVISILIGLVIALIYINLRHLEANDSVVHYEMDVNRPPSEEDAERFAEFAEAAENAGKDIILVPSEPIDVLPSEERRLRDEERFAQEEQEAQATIEAGIEAGIFVDTPLEQLACTDQVEGTNVPSIYLLCGNEIASTPADLPFTRAETLAEAEGLLTNYVLRLLKNVNSINQNTGYESYFSDPNVLNSLSLSAEGNVIIDFNDKFVELHGNLHGSNAERMLEQLNRTIFQFRDVNTISVTLNGSCEAFAQLFEFSCVSLERETWQQMLELNDDQVEYFNLIGER